MQLFDDPIIITMLCMLAGATLFLFPAKRFSDFLLFGTVLLIFALPRAGLLLSGVNLPLPFANVIVVILIIQWLFFKKHHPFDQIRINNSFMLYAIVCGIGLGVGLARGGNMFIAFLEISFYLFAIILFFFAKDTFTHKDQIKKFIYYVMFISLGVSFYGIAQRYLGHTILIDNLTYTSGSDTAKSYITNDQIYRRVLSSYGDPNVLAAQLITFLSISIALLIRVGVSFHLKLLSLLSIILCCTCIAYTGSRAGLICMILIPFLVLCWHTRWVLLFTPIILISITLISQPLIDTLVTQKIELMGNFQADIRFEFPRMGYEMLKAIPFGCGLGNNILTSFHGSGWDFYINSTPTMWHAQNSFWLTLFSRLGVPGISTFIILLYMIFNYIWNSTKNVTDPTIKAFLYGGMGGFIGNMLIWLVNNTYILPGGCLNFWFITGMMVAASKTYATLPFIVPSSFNHFPNNIPYMAYRKQTETATNVEMNAPTSTNKSSKEMSLTKNP